METAMQLRHRQNWLWHCLRPVAGARTTCLVARKLGRDYIGIVLNEEYAEMAQERIEEEASQQPLIEFAHQSEAMTEKT